MKKKIAIVAGTRPEVIKMAMLYWELKKSALLEPIFISTAQHRQMLDSALHIFGIVPDYDMDIMQSGQTLNDLTARLLQAWNHFFSQYKPDAILVQGDTTTVLASAIAAFYERIPIGHVEAGLRTSNMFSPFPEEMNRRLTTPLAKWNFCPTSLSKKNLLKENISKNSCYITGNTVIDSLLWMRKKIKENPDDESKILVNCQISKNFAEDFIVGENPKKWILVTGHRRENFGKGFENICYALKRIVEKYPDIGILYPVHLNPNVQEPVYRILGNTEKVLLIPPVAYKEFIYLMDKCHFVVSDSGGVQEEAPSLGKPVLVMRDTTERPEGVNAGTCELVGTNIDKILAAVSKLLDDETEYKRKSSLKNPYGNGSSCKKIRKILEQEFFNKS